MKRLLCQPVAVVILTLALASTALAQTGPTGPNPAPAPSNGPAVQNNSTLTPDRLSNLLRKEGHQVELKKFANGSQTVVATIQRDGWKFVVEFEFNNNATNLMITCPLGNPASQVSQAQLLALMKKTYELPGCLRFSYRNADQRFCLEDPNWNTANFSDQVLLNILTRLLQQARQTHNLWDTSRWPVNGAMPS